MIINYDNKVFYKPFHAPINYLNITVILRTELNSFLSLRPFICFAMTCNAIGNFTHSSICCVINTPVPNIYTNCWTVKIDSFCRNHRKLKRKIVFSEGTYSWYIFLITSKKHPLFPAVKLNHFKHYILFISTLVLMSNF